MSFLDNLKDKLRPQPADDGYYDDGFDDGYDDGYYNDDQAAPVEERGTGLLGNSPRPAADSVSVYTRSGRPLGGNGDIEPRPQPGMGYEPERRPVQSYVPTTTEPASYAHNDYSGASHVSTERPLTAIPRPSSSQLPPYVLKPQSYDDVQTVVRRVRTNQPVVLSFRNTNIDAAKRIFDFCAGLSCGVGGSIEELGDRCFVVLPQGRELSQGDIDKLVADGTISR